MSSSICAANELVVITSVYPRQTGPATPTLSIPNVSPVLEKVLKGEPKALGTVQILIGVMLFLLGVVLAVYLDCNKSAIYSGIVFWRAVTFSSTGSLTVVVDRRPSRCMVKGALGMNILSIITAGIAIILHCLFLISNQNPIMDDFGSYEGNQTQPISHGIMIVLLGLTILEFFVSICVIVFCCRALCDSTPEQVVVMQHQGLHANEVPYENPPIPTINTYETTLTPIPEGSAQF